MTFLRGIFLLLLISPYPSVPRGHVKQGDKGGENEVGRERVEKIGKTEGRSALEVRCQRVIPDACRLTILG